MSLLIENADQIVTCQTSGRKFKAGKYQSEIGLLQNAGIIAEKGRIKWIGKTVPAALRKTVKQKIDARGKVVLPGFIDSHTHLVFAGDRANEYSMRIKGATYGEIAKAGGGIINTVKATRKATANELLKLALKRVKTSISFGVTTIEAKSGYGLDTKTELKMLEVIKELRKFVPIDIYSTLLAAHAFPKEISRKEYIDKILFEIIPLTANRGLATFIDAFCEKNYYTPNETRLIFEQGKRFGLIPKLHTNQFYSVGGIGTAVKCEAISVDHLEVMTKNEIKALSGGNVVACVLPTVSYFLNIPYAPVRELISAKVPVAIATDFNPGSSMTENIQIAMSMGVQMLKMNIEEVINSVTINAAAALGISDVAGSIETGKQADMLIFDTHDYRDILYHFGVNQLETVIKKGKVISKA